MKRGDITKNDSIEMPVIVSEVTNANAASGEICLKIRIDNGDVLYATNVKREYRYNERTEVIRNMRAYMKGVEDISTPNPELQAYCILLWHLFGDYLNAYSFDWANPKNKGNGKSKHLYILRNSLGFIKVGIAGNVKVRVVDLKFEFDGEWEILKVYNNAGKIESTLHRRLAEYTFPVKKKYTGKYSRECFLDCPEVLSACLNLSI